MLFAGLAILVLSKIVTNLGLHSLLAFAIGLLFAILVASYAFDRHRRSRELQEFFLGPDRDDPIAVFVQLASHPSFSQDNRPIRRQLRRLVGKGHIGSVYRLWKHVRPPNVEPIVAAFEPVEVNESDVLFRRLTDLPSNVASESTPSGAHMTLPHSVFHRNIRLRGGYSRTIVAAFGVSFGLTILARSGNVPCFVVVLWGLLIAGIFLLTPANSDPKQHWLVIPGGLLRRSWKRRSETELHVFAADRSMLVAREEKNKTWIVQLADAKVDGWLRVTRFELDILLRAWCSPLPPPTVEQLSDFA